MSTSKHVDRICLIAVLCAFLLMLVFLCADTVGIEAAAKTIGYEQRLFDTEKVHTIEIVMDDWDSFIETCENEEYAACSVVIDGDAYQNVGIRAKGNTSLSTVSSMNSDRYSFKIEFDQYDNTKSYHGLDKLSLNNIIQDTTFMKDYLTYQLMGQFGVSAPLCSYVYITVNGEDWGLYLAVEGIENAFLQRNYGNDYGELYKPDSMNFGGGRGNGRDFNMEDFMNQSSEEEGTQNRGFNPGNMGGGFDPSAVTEEETTQDAARSFGGRGGFSFEIDEEALRAALKEQGIDSSVLDGVDLSSVTMDNMREVSQQLEEAGVDMQALMQAIMGSGTFEMPDMGDFGGRGGMGMGSGDVLLQYTDDDPASYSNIFDSAKTDVSDADQLRLIEALKTLSSENAADAVNIEQVIRYFVVHNFVVNGDSYTGSMIHNYYLYEEDGKLEMLPWDYNLAFGTFQGNDASSAVNDPIDTPLSVDGSGSRPIIDWIFSNEEYTALYHSYFADFLEQFDFAAMVRETVGLIAPYVERDPSKFFTYEEFEVGTEAMEQFCTLREQSVAGQLTGEIPATSDGQREDSSALIDTSGLSVSDMGSMNMGGGFGGGRGGFGNFADRDQQSFTYMPQQPGADNSGGRGQQSFSDAAMQPGGMMPQMQMASASGTEESPARTETEDAFNQWENRDFSQFQPGGMMETVNTTETWILTGISVLILLAGMLIARKYKRYG